MNNIRHEIAEALKSQRVHFGVSLIELSEKSKIKLERVIEIEEGTEWPSELELGSLMNNLNMTIIELAGSEMGHSLSRKLSALKKDKLPLVEFAIDGLLKNQVK